MVDAFPKNVTADVVIGFLGEEIGWEILATHGKWYVTAFHHGETRADSFKYNNAHKDLNKAVMMVGRSLWRHGPNWIRK